MDPVQIAQIAQHADDRPRATVFCTDEWQAFLRDTEGDLVGLVEHRVR